MSLKSKLKMLLVLGPVLAIGAIVVLVVVIGAVWLVVANVRARNEAKREWEQEQVELRVQIAKSKAAKLASPSKTAVAAATPAPEDKDNLLKNPSFSNLDCWNQFHITRVQDAVTLQEKDGVLMWERTQGRGDGGSVGVQQELDIDVSDADSAILSLDVRVSYQTQQGPELWTRKLNYPAQMPVHIAVLYDNKRGFPERWDYGFVIHDYANHVLEANPKTQVWRYRPGATPLRNATPVPKDKWCRFSIDLMKHMDPRPAKIAGIMLYGNGLEFRGSVHKVRLEVE